MTPTDSNLITVCPRNLDRSGFLELGAGANRTWLLARLSEGLQIRMLRPPLQGYITFCTGPASWVPIRNGAPCVVVQSLGCKAGVEDLLDAAEDWARYYDFSAVIVLMDTDTDVAGYTVLDQTQTETRLLCKILQGPIALPRLPQNWSARVAALGPGLVVQCTARSDAEMGAAQDLMARAKVANMKARLDLIETAKDARDRLIFPTSDLSATLDGKPLNTHQESADQIW